MDLSDLDIDLQRVVQEGAKVYNAPKDKQGKVIIVTESQVNIQYTDKSIDVFDLPEFKNLLKEDKIVSSSRLTMGSGNKFKVRPRVGKVGLDQSLNPKPSPKPVQPVHPVTRQEPKIAEYKIGYLKEKTGRFSKTPKEGYTKIEYKECTETITLQVTEAELNKLRELGLIK